MDSESFGDFEKVFRSQLCMVEDVINLRDAGQDDTCVRQLTKLNSEVQTVQDNLSRCKLEITSSVDSIKQIKAACNFLEQLKIKLTHMLDNIPERLPKPQRELPTHNAPVSAKVQKSATSQSKLSSESRSIKSVMCAKDSSKDPRKVSNIYLPEIEFLTIPEFESVPKYMKGRLTYDVVNKFVEGFNKSYESKYKLMKQKCSSMNLQTRQKYDAYKMQETKDTKDCYFITEDDLKEYTGLKVDNVTRSIIPILRHVGRIRELRGGKIIRYVYVDHY